MKTKLSCILLIDDDPSCNFIHERLLMRMGCTEKVEIARDGVEGLEFLRSKNTRPDIIFLDINMPKMNGWEFLEEYQHLSEEEKSKIVIVMLTSSLNPDDRTKAESYSAVSDYDSKYLDEEAVNKILHKHFKDHF